MILLWSRTGAQGAATGVPQAPAASRTLEGMILGPQFKAFQPRLFDVSGIPTKKGPYQEPRPNPGFEQPYEGTIGKYLYHHSSPRNRSSIRQQGLVVKDPLRRSAKGVETRETAPEGIYLGPHNHVGHQPGRDVWAVDTNKVRTRPDPSDHDNYWGFHYSSDPIPPDAMKLIYKGKR